MAGNLLVRAATEEDTESILDLVRVSLGEGTIPRSAEYWDWKHHRNPFGTSPCLLAVADGRVVGLRVFMRWGWRAEGSVWPSVRAVDTATHPEWRGKGIFSRLTLSLLEEMEAEGVSFVFNTPNGRSRPGYLKMGWTSVGRISLWIRPLRLRALARLPLGGYESDDSVPMSRDEQQSGFSVPRLFEDPCLEAFLDGLQDRGARLSTPRTSRYLRWRYAEVPGFDYRAVWQLEGNEGGIVIGRVKRRGGLRELRICEVLVGSGPKSRRIARELLRGWIGDTGADYAAAMSRTGTAAQALLLGRGFLPLPRLGPVMTVRPLNEMANGLDPLRRSDWDLSLGDLELF